MIAWITLQFKFLKPRTAPAGMLFFIAPTLRRVMVASPNSESLNRSRTQIQLAVNKDDFCHRKLNSLWQSTPCGGLGMYQSCTENLSILPFPPHEIVRDHCTRGNECGFR
jgi:hypothetical protein